MVESVLGLWREEFQDVKKTKNLRRCLSKIIMIQKKKKKSLFKNQISLLLTLVSH